MTAPRGAFRCLSGVALSVLWACERTQPSPGKDTTVPVTPPPESIAVTLPPPAAWDSSAGPALLVAGQSPREATVILPAFTDSASLDTARFNAAPLQGALVELYAASGHVGEARIERVTAREPVDGCRSWPSAALSLASGDTTAVASWTVAFVGSRAEPVAVDSIETLASADSAKLAADVARLASALPGDTAAAFRGLPFVVRKVWRFTTPPAGSVLLAVIVRNVNQEANPLQQRLLIVAERDTTVPGSRYRTAYHERISGLEETVETTEPLAVVLLGESRRPTVVLARESATGTSYALLERTPATWRVRWTSAHVRC